ncbi:Uncharacterised protein [uncultured archaeon]|nr:Uncharacterised protein [uncultured archaeon]
MVGVLKHYHKIGIMPLENSYLNHVWVLFLLLVGSAFLVTSSFGNPAGQFAELKMMMPVPIMNPGYCGNGVCDAGENGVACPADCGGFIHPIGRGSYCGNGIKETGEVCDGNDGCKPMEMCASNCSKCIKMPYCGDGICETWENELDWNTAQMLCGIKGPITLKKGDKEVETCQVPRNKVCSPDCGCPDYLTGWVWGKSVWGNTECTWLPNDGVCQLGETDCRDCPCGDGWACKEEKTNFMGKETTTYVCKASGSCGDGICAKRPNGNCLSYGPDESIANCCRDCACPDGYRCKTEDRKVQDTTTNPPSEKTIKVDVGCKPICGDGKCVYADAKAMLESLAGKGAIVTGSESCAEKILYQQYGIEKESYATCCQDGDGKNDCSCPCSQQGCEKIRDGTDPGNPEANTHVCMNCKELMIISEADFNYYTHTIQNWSKYTDIKCLDKCQSIPDNRAMANTPDDVLAILEGFCSKCKNTGTKLENFVIMGHGESFNSPLKPDGTCDKPTGRIFFPQTVLDDNWITAHRDRLEALRGCFAPGAHMNFISCFMGDTQIPLLFSEIWPDVTITAGSGPVSCDEKTKVCVPQNYVCIYQAGVRIQPPLDEVCSPVIMPGGGMGSCQAPLP